MIVVVGATVGWLAAKYFTGRVVESESVEVRLPPTGGEQRAATPSTADARIAARPEERSTGAPPGKPAAATPPPAALSNTVASYPLNLSYALSQWSLGKSPSGFFDSAKLNGRVVTTGGASTPVARDTLIELSGWTGDGSVGVRYPYVLISSCGKIVAHAEVNQARPDVAKAVHVNLGQSGWRARIALRHLPGCENLELRAWGVAPGDSRLILPLNGQLALSVFVPSVAQATDNGVVSSAAPPLRPADMKPLPPVRLNVTANVLNIRRCAGVSCAIVGKLAKGEWTVLTLDETDSWLLVATPDRAGWVSKRYVGVSGRPG